MLLAVQKDPFKRLTFLILGDDLVLLAFLPYSACGWRAGPSWMSQAAFLIYFLHGLLDSSFFAISSQWDNWWVTWFVLPSIYLQYSFVHQINTLWGLSCVDRETTPCLLTRPALWISTFISFSLCDFPLYRHLLHPQVHILQLLLLFYYLLLVRNIQQMPKPAHHTDI